MWGIIIGTKYKPTIPDTDATPSQLEKYSDWADHHGIARSTILLLGMEPRLQDEYSVIPDARELWAKLSDAYKAQIKLNIFDIQQSLFDTNMEDFSSVSAYAASVEEQVVAFNLGAAAGTTTTTTAADTTTTTTAAGTTTTATCQCGRRDGMADNEHAFFLINGVPRTDDWQVFLQIMRDKPDIQATPSEVIGKLLARETDLRREKGLDPETSLFTRTARRGAGRGRGRLAGRCQGGCFEGEQDLQSLSKERPCLEGLLQ